MTALFMLMQAGALLVFFILGLRRHEWGFWSIAGGIALILFNAVFAEICVHLSHNSEQWPTSYRLARMGLFMIPGWLLILIGLIGLFHYKKN